MLPLLREAGKVCKVSDDNDDDDGDDVVGLNCGFGPHTMLSLQCE